MPSRWCPNHHLVSDATARYCPTCGVPLPPPPSQPEPPAAGDAFWVQALRAGAIGLCVVLLGAYVIVVAGNAARERARTPSVRPSPTLARVVSLARTTATPTRTRRPTSTPLPTATPRPTSTPKPVLKLTPAQFRSQWDRLTEVQQKGFVASVTGQRIRWTCDVFQIRDDGTLTLDCESGAMLTSIMVRGTIPRAGAERYNKGQAVTFEADITGIDTLLIFTVNVGPIIIIE